MQYPTNMRIIRVMCSGRIQPGFVLRAFEKGEEIAESLPDDLAAMLAGRLLGSHLPIIALTAHAMVEDRERCLTSGCSDYLTKPVNKQQLIQVLRTYLQPVLTG